MIPNVNVLNRSENVRRDNDSQKNFSIGLMDIDETILNHIINNLKPEVIQGGVIKKVLCKYAPGELWEAMKKESFVRDYNGKFQLPAIVLKRTFSADDGERIHFNRYLNETVIQTHSPKNRYTKFSTLNGKNAPVHELYNITFPSHMKLTYKCIIWTELVEQMNKLVELFQFAGKDYFGNREGYKFKVDGISFGHTVELQSGDDRMVKTEFELTVHGYILPETMAKLDSQESTFKKSLTPKKIVLGLEVVGDDYNFETYNSNSGKWKNQQYPNKDSNEIIPTAPVSVVDGIADITSGNSIVSTLNKIRVSGQTNNTTSNSSVQNFPYLRIVGTPNSVNSIGQSGDVSYDDDYFYIHTTDNQWKRVAISSFC
jgi:hypothetical protein